MKLRRVIAATAAGAMVAFSGAGAAPAGATCSVPSFSYRHGTVTFAARAQTTRVRVEIADTLETREVGLMCRTALDPDGGMLFVFAASTQGAFWMKNTLIPLSIAFIDSGWHIVHFTDMKVAPDPETGPFQFYAPSRPYRYALEVNQGFFTRHGIDERSEVRFQPKEAAEVSPVATSIACHDASARGVPLRP